MPAKKKPTHVIRKPAPKPPAAAVASFVEPEAPATTAAAPAGRTSVITLKRSGGQKQKMTLWFSPETVRAVKLQAVMDERKESALVEEAVREFLERKKAEETS